MLESVIVRRTRTDIRNTPDYWQDIINQGVTFPDITFHLNKYLYELDSFADNLYDYYATGTLKKQSKDLRVLSLSGY